MDKILNFAVLIISVSAVLSDTNYTSEEEALEFLNDTKISLDGTYTVEASAQWDYASNLTDFNQRIMMQVEREAAQFYRNRTDEINKFSWQNFTNSKLKRQFKLQSLKGMSALPTDQFNKLNNLTSQMEGTYGKGIVKSKDGKKELHLEPELTKIMSDSRDYNLLEFAWKGWRDAVGKPIRGDYKKYVNISNEGAKLNGFKDYTEYLLNRYETDTFLSDIEELWNQVKPLYEQLHAYVRRKLISKYGDKNIKTDGTIPAHLLGNMWAQTWGNVMDLVSPYPKKQVIDVTQELKEKKYTPTEMFKESEKFFVSLGLKPMTPEFWTGSIITKPKNRPMVCHGSAWDFGNHKDYRIKMCTEVTMDDFFTIHHEMGHIEYFMQYADQPLVFREGANPGFHEAIGDTLALSVMTPEHLHKIHLLDKVVKDKEADLNFLMNMALDKIAFLPFGYLIDKYRWEIFSGKTKMEHLNQRWWELRESYQGVSPPVKRSEEDFDAGAKYHVPAGVPYVRYFVSFIIQFQFHEALCKVAGYNGSLHHCDISQAQYPHEAGKRLADMLQLGSSVKWQEAMEVLTGTTKMDASSLMKYFEPLHEWLKAENKKNKVKVGWKLPKPADAMKPDRPPPPPPPTPTENHGTSAVSYGSSMVLICVISVIKIFLS